MTTQDWSLGSFTMIIFSLWSNKIRSLYFLCTGHCAGSFNHHNQSMRWVLFSSPFHGQGTRDSECLSHLPEATQLTPEPVFVNFLLFWQYFQTRSPGSPCCRPARKHTFQAFVACKGPGMTQSEFTGCSDFLLWLMLLVWAFMTFVFQHSFCIPAALPQLSRISAHLCTKPHSPFRWRKAILSFDLEV